MLISYSDSKLARGIFIIYVRSGLIPIIIMTSYGKYHINPEEGTKDNGSLYLQTRLAFVRKVYTVVLSRFVII